MANRSKSMARKVISMVFAFIIAMLTFFTTLLAILQLTVLTPDYMLKEMDKTNYYSKLTGEIEQQFSSLGAATGFDKAFFNGIINQYMVSEHVNQHVYVFYGKSETEIDTSDIEQDLLTKFYAYADEKAVEHTADLDAGLTYLAQHCKTIYDKMVYSSYLDFLSTAVAKLRMIVPIGIIVMAILITFLIITIFAINPFKHRAVRTLIYAISGGGLMVLGVPVLVLASGKVKHLAIAAQAMFELVVGYVNDMMLMMLISVFAYALLVAVLAAIYKTSKKHALGN